MGQRDVDIARSTSAMALIADPGGLSTLMPRTSCRSDRRDHLDELMNAVPSGLTLPTSGATSPTMMPSDSGNHDMYR
jgi:hypothetical protein